MITKMGKNVQCTFFSLEKYRSKQKSISKIKLDDGSFTSDAKIILEECRKFYKKLYNKNLNVNLNFHREFFTNITTPKLSEQDKQFCETNLTIAELLKNLKSFRKNKSPGLDRLTAELYIVFWDELKNKLFQL